jgi:hypothetical protein
MTNQVGSKAWTQNRLASRLGLRYPIIQGRLGGFVVAAAHGSRVEHFAHIGRLFRLDGDFNS